MKRTIAVFLAVMLTLSLAACGGENGAKSQTSINTKNVNDVINEQINGTTPAPETSPAPEETQSSAEPDPSVDVDLTAMSSTLVYSEVYNMLTTPDSYIGKTVKMRGTFSIYHDEATDVYYFACVIADATACCSQGIEFVLSGEHVYPDDYPELGSEITVKGTFSTYMEGENMYCTLKDAELM